MKSKLLFILVFSIFLVLFYKDVSNASEIVEDKKIEVSEDKEIGVVTLKINKEDFKNREKISFANNRMILANENVTEDYVNNYYYNQLNSNLSKQIYNILLNDVEATGNVSTNIDGYIYNVSDFSQEKRSELFDKYLAPYICDGLHAFIEERAERYWWNYDISFSYTYINYTNLGKLEFSEIELIAGNCPEKTKRNEFNKKLEEVAASIQGNSIYDIVEEAHNYICRTVKYELSETSNINHTAYGALMNYKAVCDGQSSLFVLLCRKNNIKAITVSGDSINSTRRIGRTSVDIYLSPR